MAQKHIDQTIQSLETLLEVRREHVAKMTTQVNNHDLDRLVLIQTALEALQKVLADEEKRLPSIFET